MSSGPEHYREAERLTQVAEGESWYEEDGRLSRVSVLLAAAQAHATLALAAATFDDSLDREAWFEALRDEASSAEQA